jgi:putative transcriptional regulator
VELCNRLKHYRRQKGLTQEALARAVGVTRQTIIAVERGRHEPSVRLALEIARTLSVPIEELFWLKERGDMR